MRSLHESDTEEQCVLTPSTAVNKASQTDQPAELQRIHDTASTSNSHAFETVEERATRLRTDSQNKMSCHAFSRFFSSLLV